MVSHKLFNNINLSDLAGRPGRPTWQAGAVRPAGHRPDPGLTFGNPADDPIDPRITPTARRHAGPMASSYSDGTGAITNCSLPDGTEPIMNNLPDGMQETDNEQLARDR